MCHDQIAAQTSLLVRMNFSHGSYEYHQSVIDNTRKMVAGEYGLSSNRLFKTLFQPIPMAALLRLLSTQCVLRRF